MMTTDQIQKTEEKIVDVLRTVYDPEIPVNIYDLGLIYSIDLDPEGNLSVEMTFTAPDCPIADVMLTDAQTKLEAIDDVKSVVINIVFEPQWDKEMMTEEAKLELGLL